MIVDFLTCTIILLIKKIFGHSENYDQSRPFFGQYFVSEVVLTNRIVFHIMNNKHIVLSFCSKRKEGAVQYFLKEPLSTEKHIHKLESKGWKKKSYQSGMC